MTTLAKPIQGILDIGNIQGNYRKIDLQFDFTDWPDVSSLSDFDDIRMEVKELYSVRSKAFLVFDLTEGLTIVGNTLTFILDEEFWNKQVKNWVYDITFLLDDKRYTLIKGDITNDLTASKL